MKILKTHSDSIPAEIFILGGGTIDVNLNVKEETIRDDQNNTTRKGYFFDTYRFDSMPSSYDEIINALIRTKYGISEEFAILRQKDTKPTEYAPYNEFCESCKTLGKAIYAKLLSEVRAAANAVPAPVVEPVDEMRTETIQTENGEEFALVI